MVLGVEEVPLVVGDVLVELEEVPVVGLDTLFEDGLVLRVDLLVVLINVVTVGLLVL